MKIWKLCCRFLLKKAIESGEVHISAVRHRKPRAKSEPALTAALLAELEGEGEYSYRTERVGTINGGIKPLVISVV